MWLLPLLPIVFTLIIAIPLSKYIAWIMEGRHRPWALFRWFEARLDTGPMNCRLRALGDVFAARYPDDL